MKESEESKSSIGVIGAGRIGSSVLLKANAIGFKTIFYDPYKEQGHDKVVLATKCDELEEFISVADIISINAVLNKETNCMVNKKFIDQMKNGSYLINTARGPLLDYKALHDALSNGKLKGAALDTFYEEPLPKNHIFKNLNNVTITPHIAGASVKTAYYAAEVIAKDVRNYIDGKKLVNRIC